MNFNGFKKNRYEKNPRVLLFPAMPQVGFATWGGGH